MSGADAVDLAVVGAGPAGLAAATLAAELGLGVAVLDEQERVGGQIYRGADSGTAWSGRFGADYARGAELSRAFAASGARHLAGAQVWQAEKGWTLYFTQEGTARTLQAKRVLLAVGALERPVPIPGWTLPGVVTVGAAQILLKTGGNAPEVPFWVAGSGPLPLLYLNQLLAVGIRPGGYLDTTPPGMAARGLPHALGALRNPGYLAKGAKLVAGLRRAGVRVVTAVDSLAAEGDGRLERIHWTAGGQGGEAAARVLLLHEGVVPNIHMAQALGIEHRWDEQGRCLVPVADEFGQTNVEGLLVAGDAGGIVGARAAEERGRLAALAVAAGLGRLDVPARDARAAPVRRELGRHARIRPFLDAVYRPRPAVEVPADDVLVCRCEEISAGRIREAVRVGCIGPNQVKSFTRCGMGPCQGRECALTLANVVAAARGVPVADVGYLRFRPPLKPLTLGELASLAQPNPDVVA